MRDLFRHPLDAVLLIGPTGSGKSPLGESFSKNGLWGRRCHHLDFGAELRSLSSCLPSPDGFSVAEREFICGVLDRGLLLENDHFPLAKKIIYRFLEKNQFIKSDVLVLNGIPRHTGQARDIDTFIRVILLCVLSCSCETVLSRLHSNIAGDRTSRSDDNPELVVRKLQIFGERTKPLIDHYRKKGIPVHRIDVSGSTLTTDISFRLLSLTSADPPVPFVAEPPH